jgi:hypothetical protein
VNDLERHYLKIVADAKRRFMNDRVRYELWQAATEVRRIKNVLEDSPQIDPRRFVCINAHRPVAKIQRPNIIEAKNVIDVAVRNQNRVEVTNAGSQRLLTKI